jgi:acyl carrier protein
MSGSDNANVVLREYLPLPRQYRGPNRPTEARLAEIWRTVLSMDQVGVDDNYHDLGGDSFHAEVICAMIEEAFTITLSIATLVDAPTIAELAVKIDTVVRP